MFVHMFAPETDGAVVGVAVSGYTSAALLADKILNGFDKTFHQKILICEWYQSANTYESEKGASHLCNPFNSV